MIWRRDQWTVYFIVMAVTVAALICGQLLWQQVMVTRPLDKELQEIQGVESVSWDEKGKGGDNSAVYIALNQVNNLQKTYCEISDAVNRISGHNAIRIIIRDHRTPELENLYYAIHYQIQEAVFTGNFASMAERITTQAKAAQVEDKVYVDARYVYIQMTKGESGLYMVIPRQADKPEVK